MRRWLVAPIFFVACTHDPPPVNTTIVDVPSSSASTASIDAPPSSVDMSSPEPSGKLEGHTLTISPKGFMQSCATRPVVTVAETDGGTRVADQSLPGKGNYYLDGKYAGYMMCDVVVCNAASDLPVELIEYEKIGSRLPTPAGNGTAPAYRTRELKGVITVTLDYFSDDKCSVPKRLTQTVTR